MSYAIRRDHTPLEQQYQSLKKQFAADLNNNSSKKQRETAVIDQVTLSGNEPDNPDKLKPSEPVTPDEARALRGQISLYA